VPQAYLKFQPFLLKKVTCSAPGAIALAAARNLPQTFCNV
jgi:hypothetical protein